MTTNFKLTQFAKGAGCGCKISPAVLNEILSKSRTANSIKSNLIVGNSSNDDAAVYDLENGSALIVTTDFFMPIVDDAFTFGQVAAANALSDVYAMGGKPITALAILGWPIDKLPAELAAEVMDGAAQICNQAGIVISGGHTIDSAEPFFGLTVNGMAQLNHIKQNNTAQLGDAILLSKPIGVGILATAQKRGVLTKTDEDELLIELTKLNSFGEQLGKQNEVHAMTDVTGFGILGHLVEMSEGSKLTAQINYNNIPKLAAAINYAKQSIIPDATYRNWNAYSDKVTIAPSVDAMEAFTFLPDPQTNGGLLISVDKNEVANLQTLASNFGVTLTPIGNFIAQQNVAVQVN
ncbi:MAG: selenide, water dikinase SelD [Bacteroidia bacterium]|nr:selenide, water dikinase SelD [Bacteroidia bacterium]MBP9688698.1 selenide, water dikinase SelD [Bacteroidia bacterium]